eukprot:TRINITY_DN136990_c0_g1_i1.p1 TRINITY_DN136990_c0_g1~~TRINITY_DN136990_c0_g1_i1.p1  ORF type:complete len:115 (-),score=3.00 TRINITY_DN136990_c0_g1_i1:35-379(-)
MKRIALLFIASLLLISSLGCAKLGKTTGKVVKEVKEMPGEFHKGYKEGRNSEDDSIQKYLVYFHLLKRVRFSSAPEERSVPISKYIIYSFIAKVQPVSYAIKYFEETTCQKLLW